MPVWLAIVFVATVVLQMIVAPVVAEYCPRQRHIWVLVSWGLSTVVLAVLSIIAWLVLLFR